MSQNSKNIIARCYHPKCLNRGAPADFFNENCWLSPDDERRIFCSKECLEHYQENRNEIEEESKEYERIKKLKQRRIKNLVNAMYFSSDRTIDKKILKKMVLDLGLFSAFMDGNVPREITMFLKLKGIN